VMKCQTTLRLHIGPTKENMADGKKQMAMMTPVPDTVVVSRASQDIAQKCR
jgi:hypothetical protein